MFKHLKNIINFTLILSIVLLIGCGSKTMKKVKDLVEVGMYEEAVPLLEMEVQEHPKNAEAHFLLGRCHLALGNINAGSEAFSRAIKIKPILAKQVGKVVYELAEEFSKRSEKAFMYDSLIDLSLYYDPSLREKVSKDFFNKALETQSEYDFFRYLEKAVQASSKMKKPAAEELIKKANTLLNSGQLEKADRYYSKAMEYHFTEKMKKLVAEEIIRRANELLDIGELKKADKYYSQATKYHSDVKEKIREQWTSKLEMLDANISNIKLVEFLNLAKKYQYLSILGEKILNKAESLLKVDNTTAAQTYLRSGIELGLFQNQQAFSSRLNSSIIELNNQMLSINRDKFIETMKYFTPQMQKVADARGLYLRTAFHYYNGNTRNATETAKLISNKYPQSKEALLIKALIEPLPAGRRVVNLSKSGDFGWGSFAFTINWLDIKTSPPSVIFNVSIRNILSDKTTWFIFSGDWKLKSSRSWIKRTKERCESENFYILDDLGNRYYAKMPLFTDIAVASREGSPGRQVFNFTNDAIILNPRQEITHDIIFPIVKKEACMLTFVSPTHNGHQWEIKFKNIPLRDVKFERIR